MKNRKSKCKQRAGTASDTPGSKKNNKWLVLNLLQIRIFVDSSSTPALILYFNPMTGIFFQLRECGIFKEVFN
jgi:hypothetical protein